MRVALAPHAPMHPSTAAAALPRPQIDLIVIDQHEWERPGSPANPSSPRYVRGGRYLEEIWVQIQSHGRSADTAPAVFVVSTGYTLDVNELGPKKLTKEEDTHLHRCIWSCAYDKELVPTCGDFKANGFFIYAQHAVGGGAVEDFHSRVLHWCDQRCCSHRLPHNSPSFPVHTRRGPIRFLSPLLLSCRCQRRAARS